MSSIIEDSLKEYTDLLEGKPNNVQTVNVTIPVRKEFNAESIKHIRKEINVTQAGLAKILGVSTRTVESWEANRTEPNRTTQKLLSLLSNDYSLANTLRMI